MPTVVTLTTPAPEIPARGSWRFPCRLVRLGCVMHDGRPVPVHCAYCPNKRPEIDWTGHTYKATSELRIDYGRDGRERMRGKPDHRNIPPIPGGKTRTAY